MNRICERVKSETVLAPVSQEAAGNTTSAYVYGQEKKTIDFVLTFGALAAGKKLTLELLNATDGDGADAKTLSTVTLTAPEGGWTSGCHVVSVPVKGDLEGYYALKVTNDAAAAVLIGIVAQYEPRFTPDLVDCTLVM